MVVWLISSMYCLLVSLYLVSLQIVATHLYLYLFCVWLYFIAEHGIILFWLDWLVVVWLIPCICPIWWAACLIVCCISTNRRLVWICNTSIVCTIAFHWIIWHHAVLTRLAGWCVINSMPTLIYSRHQCTFIWPVYVPSVLLT